MIIPALQVQPNTETCVLLATSKR